MLYNNLRKMVKTKSNSKIDGESGYTFGSAYEKKCEDAGMCPDPIQPLASLCIDPSGPCGPNGLNDEDFPFLTSKTTPRPTLFSLNGIGVILRTPGWILPVLATTGLTALLAWLQDRGDITSDFDSFIVDQISSVAIATFLFASYSILTGRGKEQAIAFENMGNAVTSMALGFSSKFTIESAKALKAQTFRIPSWEDPCSRNPAREIEVNGRLLFCHIAAAIIALPYATTFLLTEEGINNTLLPVRYSLLYTYLRRYTSPRNQISTSVLLRTALSFTTFMIEKGIIAVESNDAILPAADAFNTALGNLKNAKTIRINRFSNNFLRVIILLTVPFFPLATTYNFEFKILAGFIVAFVLYVLLAIRTQESEITNLKNELAGVYLKDEDDAYAYEAAAHFAWVTELMDVNQSALVGRTTY